MSKFVQYYKKEFQSTPKQTMFRAKHRFQSTEPGGEPGGRGGETKDDTTTKTRPLDRFDALKKCLVDIGKDGMFDNDKKTDKVIKEVEKELWAKSKAAKEEWVEAWNAVRDIQSSKSVLYNMPNWLQFKGQSQQMRKLFDTIDKKSMGDRDKKNLDKKFKKIKKKHRNDEKMIYDTIKDITAGQPDDNTWAKKWRKAVRERIRAYSVWNQIFRLSTWKAGMIYETWTPPSVTQYTSQQNVEGNTDDHDAQIKIRSWARLVIEKFLVGKKIEVFYLIEDEGEAGKWETFWVYSGNEYNTFMDGIKGYDYDEDDDRLYISKIDPKYDPKYDQVDDVDVIYDFIPLNLLRIEPDDPEEDTIRFPQKIPYKDEEEDPDTLDSDDAALDSSDDEESKENYLIGEIGIVVKESYAYIGKITGSRPTPKQGFRTPPTSAAEDSDDEDNCFLANLFEYELTCGSDHVTDIWKEGDKRYFLESIVDIYEPDDYYKEGDMFEDLKIARIYTKLEGPDAGKEVAVLANDEEKTFKEMMDADEQADINNAEANEEEEEKNDEKGEETTAETIFDYTDPENKTYQVKWDLEADEVGPYVVYKTVGELKEQTKQKEDEELERAALMNYQAEQDEKALMNYQAEQDEKGKQNEEDGEKDGEEGINDDGDDEDDEDEDNEEDDEDEDKEDEVSLSKLEAQMHDENANARRTQTEWQHLFDIQSELVNLITLDGKKKFNGVDASLINKHKNIHKTGTDTDESSDGDFE